MIVSRVKSFLYPSGSFATNPPPFYKTWSISTVAFTSLGVPIGRDVDVNKIWNEKVKKVSKRLSSIPFHDLPLASRCSIINIYCYSMIVYLDRFLPCPGPILDQLHRASLNAIWRNSSSVSVNEHRLCTPQVHGGFDLISLKNRLAGPRAEWIYRLLTIPESSRPFVLAIRGRLQKYLLLHPAHQWNYDPFSFQRERSPFFPVDWDLLPTRCVLGRLARDDGDYDLSSSTSLERLPFHLELDHHSYPPCQEELERVLLGPLSPPSPPNTSSDPTKNASPLTSVRTR